MNLKTRIIAVLLLAAAPALAQDIRLSAGQMENLGIELVAPQRATEVAAIRATARVVVPPDREAVVGTAQDALVTGLTAAVGDEVVAGQVLARLQSPDFLVLQREFFDALTTDVLARSELNRDRQLHEEGIVSARRFEETATRSRMAAASVAEHRQLLRIAGLDDKAIATLESDRRLRESLEIRAPFDGVVLERLVTTGQRIDAMSPLYRVADLSELWLEVAVPQEQMAGLAPGLRVTGTADTFEARVVTVARAIDPATQSVTLRARVERGDETLSPGQVVAVRVDRAGADASGRGVWAVPSAAVARRAGVSFVFVRSSAGFEPREVEVIGAGDDQAFLAARLDGSERIAASGIAALKSMWAAAGEDGPG